MPMFVIEREMPGVGSLPPDELRAAASKSNEAVAGLAPRVQWQHSYLAGDKLYCLYLAENEEALREHAQQAGVPADAITRVISVIDPTTGGR